VKPSSNGQFPNWAWSFGICDESYQHNSHWNSVGWQIAMDVKIGFKLQVTATPGFHTLYEWCFRMMWLF
jgi:hypothetical protein